MTNIEISKIFQQIADMLELKDANAFEMRAYQQAARAIEYVGEEAADIYRRGGLKALDEIPGVGPSIAGHIRELLETGKLKKYDKLRKQIPEVELRILDIPGIGPKTAKKLYQTLKPKDQNELDAFLRTVLKKASDLKKSLKGLSLKERRRLEKLHQLGLQRKSLENILRGIDILKQRSGRMLISFAHPIAMQALGEIKKFPEIKQANVVGSLRRMKDTIGDIDIIAALQNQKSKIPPRARLDKVGKNQNGTEVINNFISLPFVKEVINKGETKARVIHELGVQIDLEILPKEKYGSLLQHLTGSKEHNVALRTWGVEHGFSISEHGIRVQSKFQTPKSKNDNSLITCDTEEKVYQTLGMQWIPPELRENRGEIEAALKHQLPKLIELQDIKGDLQVHTNWSDGHNTVYDMARAAQDFGYQYIALTDHSVGLGVARGLDQKRFNDRHREIMTAQKKLKIKILEGVEVNIKANGRLDLPGEALQKFDYVLAAIHSSFNQDKETMTRRIIGAIKQPFVHAIAHPTGRLIERRPSYEADWGAVFKAAAQHRKLLEIDGFPDRLDMPDNYVLEARKSGVKFVIGTDSHRIEHLGYMRLGVSVGRRGWLTKAEVLNTMEGEDLLKWLGK